jgi:hypothetical protein
LCFYEETFLLSSQESIHGKEINKIEFKIRKHRKNEIRGPVTPFEVTSKTFLELNPIGR